MSAIARRTAQELEEAMARIAALEAELAEARAALEVTNYAVGAFEKARDELAEARAGLARERADWADLLRTVATDARAAALEEAAMVAEGYDGPSEGAGIAVGIRALKEPKP